MSNALDEFRAQRVGTRMERDHEMAARRRALYPNDVRVEYLNPQMLVTVSMDADLYVWLQRIAGRSSFTSTVEETVTSAVRALRGDIDRRMVIRDE